ncbi:MAG: CBS domain-containing protein [Candidatus Omnitrophica bacterium]|nr:CBS domain-containing protein [Candidatus Omnitrophota bacterium]
MKPETEGRKALKALLEETKVKDVMTREVLSIGVDDSFSKVPEFFQRTGFRHLPVVGENGRFMGLITERDLYKIRSPRKLIDGSWYYDSEMLDDVILKHVMVKDTFTMSPEATLAEALTKMTICKYGCVPILEEDGTLCGILTQHDLLRVAYEILKGKRK